MLKTRMSVFWSVMQAGALRQEIGIFAEFTTRVNRYFVISVRASFLVADVSPRSTTHIPLRISVEEKKHRERNVVSIEAFTVVGEKKYRANEISRRK